VPLATTSHLHSLRRRFSFKLPRQMRKRGGRAKRSCECFSRLVGRDLTGKLTVVIFSFYFLLLSARGRKGKQIGTFMFLSTRAHLADEEQNPESKLVGGLRRVSSFLFCPGLAHQLLFVSLVVDPLTYCTRSLYNQFHRHCQFQIC
jgi:hypothetical protein